MRSIPFDLADPDSVEAARDEIGRQMTATGEVETPISRSIEIQRLRQSEDPVDRSIVEVVNALSDLRLRFGEMEKRLSSPEQLLPLNYFRFAVKDAGVQGGLTRSFRAVLSETQEFMEALDREGLLQGDDSKLTPLKRRMEFILHMIESELREG